MDWLNYHHLRYFWTVVREGAAHQGLDHPTVAVDAGHQIRHDAGGGDDDDPARRDVNRRHRLGRLTAD